MRFLILLTYLLYLVPELLANDDSNEPSIEESKVQLAKSYLCRYGYMNKNLCYSRTQSANQFLRHHAKQITHDIPMEVKLAYRNTGDFW